MHIICVEVGFKKKKKKYALQRFFTYRLTVNWRWGKLFDQYLLIAGILLYLRQFIYKFLKIFTLTHFMNHKESFNNGMNTIYECILFSVTPAAGRVVPSLTQMPATLTSAANLNS